MGIVGVSIVIGNQIDTFLMSCRALGREVEATMLKILVNENQGLSLEGHYIPTKKNKMVESFYDANGFSMNSIMGDEKKYVIADGPAPKYIIPTVKVDDV
jgi:predicted enzyme involved in methoxymalonyl-ACP biosynthesis